MSSGFPIANLKDLGGGWGGFSPSPLQTTAPFSLCIPKVELDSGYRAREGEEVVIAVDSMGIKVTNRGEWMRRKKKGYIKIRVAVDTRTKQVVSLEVSDEKTHDGEKLKPLVKKARVKKVLGDGGYDSHENFDFLAS